MTIKPNVHPALGLRRFKCRQHCPCMWGAAQGKFSLNKMLWTTYDWHTSMEWPISRQKLKLNCAYNCKMRRHQILHQQTSRKRVTLVI